MAFEMRRSARLRAREMMEDSVEVELLRERDRRKYGDPDGPTFEQLVKEERDRGAVGESPYRAIIDSACRTDATMTERTLKMPRGAPPET